MADKDMMNENVNDVDLESGTANIGSEDLQPNSQRDKLEKNISIEDLPLQERLTLVKNLANPFGSLKPGLFIDALDSINTWCVATIVEVDENMLKVHFDGWPNKWDEWMRITSYKIAPFRRHSIGYTGQTKVAIRKIDREHLCSRLKGYIQQQNLVRAWFPLIPDCVMHNDRN